MESPEISNEAVQAKTGKNWDEWFAILDTASGKDLNHKDIVAFLDKNYGIDPWWQQSVTVAYEQARGLRKKHEMADGYQISKSITIQTLVGRVYTAWMDELARAKWLEDPNFIIRKANPNKSLRITWVDPKTSVEVYFYPKDNRVQVTLNHSKLPNKDQAEMMKEYWARQFGKLKVFLEKYDPHFDKNIYSDSKL
jgi:uncharacterized protein YndB with AHSA1/START domain